MSSRIAVIDLGTNTFNVLIAEKTGDKLIRLFSEEIPVKLGEGGINAGLITAEAWARGLAAIHYIQQKTEQYHCKQIKAIATSAIRSASNGEQFKLAVQKATGVRIETIDGNTEALLIYKGVRKAVSIRKTSLIMDIGGGSVEFIICDQNKLFWQASFPIGAARLKEGYVNSDPISEPDISNIERHLEHSLQELFHQCQLHHPECLIGSAGAFESFAEIISLKHNRQFDRNTTEFIFQMEEFHQLVSEIIASTHSDRQNIPGLIAFRIDMIIPATILTEYIMRRTGVTEMKLSAYALKEGVLESLNEIN